MKHFPIAVIGGGLAGCECAHQLAEAGVPSVIFEMKPQKFSPAHSMEGLAELVCSNSFRSDELGSAVGLLKAEMRSLGSLVMEAAEATRVPAGKALAVDRDLFSRFMSERIAANELITVERKEITSLDDPALAGFDKVVVAAGPLAGEGLAESLAQAIGQEGLYFYDAIAPVVTADSIDMNIAFWGSRWNPEEHDYLNLPMDEAEYNALVEAMLAADKVKPRDFEKEIHFEGCMPVEALAERGHMTLAFGPLKPVGLSNPHKDEQPFAVLQLRIENAARTAFNLVGCQTKMTYPEQKRVFRMIPGLENAEFERLGSIHRNTYVNAPKVLNERLELKNRPGIHLAGQITGVEGYVESAACGLWLGMLLAGEAEGNAPMHPPQETALGALLNHLRSPVDNFQPSNVIFGLMPPLNVKAKKRRRKELHAERAKASFGEWVKGVTNI